MGRIQRFQGLFGRGTLFQDMADGPESVFLADIALVNMREEALEIRKALESGKDLPGCFQGFMQQICGRLQLIRGLERLEAETAVPARRGSGKAAEVVKDTGKIK